jgi:four helix bundle protein
MCASGNSSVECGVRNAEYKGRVMGARRLAGSTRAFASAIVALVEELPRGRVADVIGLQLLRAGTSVGANYRSACRARSRREFIAKMGIVEEEADEAGFWLELLAERGLVDTGRLDSLCRDAGHIVAMTVSSIRTARRASPSTPRSALRIPHSITGNPQCS